MKKFVIFCILSAFFADMVSAQRAKLSPFVREAVMSANHNPRMKAANGAPRTITAFVKSADIAPLNDADCKVLARWNDLYIASIPLQNVERLAADKAVMRIEASHPLTLTNDTCSQILGTRQVWQGEKLPQAFTGSGVVVGIQDIGFDFTHPTFGSRIRKVWDMLSRDTVGSSLPVGREYASDELSTVQHTFDGLQETHGTHTAGSAAGEGFEGEYRGMAPESDIVLVANACSNNANLIDSTDLYKYTDALDILGFKYIFDYAESQGKPCVVSFSEGGNDDLCDSRLMEEAIANITGPGKILVTSAGNKGEYHCYIHKAAEDTTVSGVISGAKQVLYFARCRGKIDNKIGVGFISRTYTTEQIIACTDSILRDTIENGGARIPVTLALYPSCWDADDYVYEVSAKTDRLSFSIIAPDVEAEIFPYSGIFDAITSPAERSHSMQRPASMPSVIAVGATGYRDFITNYLGETKRDKKETDGMISQYSSRGPSLRGDIKPEIVAPGNNIISSYSSFYLENNPDMGDIKWDVKHFDHGGRTYAWNSNTGTSMSTPIVAGIIALWLQAKPTLTKDDIIDVFMHTAKHNDESLSYPNNLYGYGEIDAYAGLVYILGLEGIVSPRLISGPLFPLREGETMDIYTIDGKKVDRMDRGIYAIQLKSPDPSRCGSMLIRK